MIPADPRPWARRLTGGAAVALVLAAFWFFMLASLGQKSLTFDEIGQVTAGYTYWHFNDYRLDPENGNLPHRISALPLLWGYRFPSLDSDAWRQSSALPIADEWFHHLGNDVPSMLRRGRAVSGLLAVGLGLLVWLWSRRLFGPVGGMLSLGLFVLSPSILANGALMTADTACALFFLAATLGLWSLLHRLTAGRVLASAFAMGALFVSKSSAPLIVPIALALVAARLIDGRPLRVSVGLPGGPREIYRRGQQAAAFAGAAAVHVAVVVLVIWASFGFRYSPFAHGQPGRDRLFTPWETVANAPIPRLIEKFNGLHLLPEAYVFGQASIFSTAQAREAYLNGRYSLTGWRSFFPYTVLVKTPLPVFAVILVALGATAARWRSRQEREGRPIGRQALDSFYATLPLWALIVFFGGYFVFFSHINVGHRHILAIYPPVFVLCGAAVGWPRLRAMRAGLLALVVLLAAQVAWRFPNYLAYFNVLAGGPAHAYRHLVDSSLDWGQDLPGVKRYIEDHRRDGPFYLSYFGTASPDYYRIPARRLYSYGFSLVDPMPLPVQVEPAPEGELGAVVERMRKDRPDFEFATAAEGDGGPVAIFVQKPDDFRLGGGTYFISATLLQSLEYDLLGPWGPWNARYEERYQQLYHLVGPFLKHDADARERALLQALSGDWMKVFYEFDRYRFARLAAYLRGREPDDSIGYSILVYRLTDADLKRALAGPPPPFGPDVIDLLKKN